MEFRGFMETAWISLIRKGRSTDGIILVVLNFTPVPRMNYRVRVPRGGFWREILNSDSPECAGNGYGNLGGLHSAPIPLHGRFHSLTRPPLAAVFFKSEGTGR